MTLPTLIIVAGPPGTGKTTIAQKLSSDLGIPVFHKDAIKELLFDSLGWSDREWSKKIGVASLNLLFHIAENQLKNGKSLIIESNFKNEFDTKRIIELKEKYKFLIIQIQLKCNGEILLNRFNARSNSTERHPGHVDSGNIDEFKNSLLKGSYDHLDIGGHKIIIDTSNFETIDYPMLLKNINEYIFNNHEE